MSEIRELAMRLVKDAGVDIAATGEHAERDVYEMYRAELERIIRAAVRETYRMAALGVVIQARKVEAENTYRGRVNNVAQFAADQLQEAANAIRAEADKLEGK